jgi:hypothetical protein
MNMRVNAGLGMARITERVHQIAMSDQPNAVGAVGQVLLFAELAQRDPRQGGVHRRYPLARAGQARPMRAEVERAAHAVAKELGLGCAIEPVGHFDPVTFDPKLVKIVRQSGGKAGLQPHGHRLGRRPRRLLDQPRGADGDGHVPLRRRAEPQRGRGDQPGVGGEGHRRAVPCGS